MHKDDCLKTEFEPASDRCSFFDGGMPIKTMKLRYLRFEMCIIFYRMISIQEENNGIFYYEQ